MYDNRDLVHAMTITNLSWVIDLDLNLLSTISLAKKDIEVFLLKESCLSEIYFKDEIFDFVDIVDS